MNSQSPTLTLCAKTRGVRRANLRLAILAAPSRRQRVGARGNARTERGAADAGIGRILLGREYRIELERALASIGVAHAGRRHVAQERPVAERIFQAQAGGAQ